MGTKIGDYKNYNSHSFWTPDFAPNYNSEYSHIWAASATCLRTAAEGGGKRGNRIRRADTRTCFAALQRGRHSRRPFLSCDTAHHGQILHLRLPKHGVTDERSLTPPACGPMLDADHRQQYRIQLGLTNPKIFASSEKFMTFAANIAKKF